jgi:predicted site-specific integrase-resolvase
MSAKSDGFTGIAGEYITETQLSNHLNISVRTLQQWRVRGDGPPFTKLSRSVRYKKQSVQDWLDQQERTSTS